MKVLVLGAYGMLGHKLVQVLDRTFDVYATCRRERPSGPAFAPDHLITNVTAENLESVRDAISAVRPAAVVNCIGVVKQLAAAKDPIPSIAINALFPHQLGRLCADAKARLVHFSTDCVFSGRKGGYKETDVSDAEDLYGRTKYLGEVSKGNVVTIRSSIIGPELGTDLGLLGWFSSQRGKTVKGFTKAIYSGFSTIEMARVVDLLLTDYSQLTGVWQVASTPITKFDLLELIDEKMHLGTKVIPDDTLVCDRSLDGSRFAETTGYRAPDWPAMVAAMAEDAAKHVK